jgi:hypothetical protein
LVSVAMLLAFTLVMVQPVRDAAVDCPPPAVRT